MVASETLFRGVMFSEIDGKLLTTYTKPHYGRHLKKLEDFCERMVTSKRFTGCHIEQTVQMQGKEPEWYLYS